MIDLATISPRLKENYNINGLVQDCGVTTASALEISQLVLHSAIHKSFAHIIDVHMRDVHIDLNVCQQIVWVAGAN